MKNILRKLKIYAKFAKRAKDGCCAVDYVCLEEAIIEIENNMKISSKEQKAIDNFSKAYVEIMSKKLDKTMKVKKLHPNATIPSRSNEDDAGLDLYALEDQVLKIGRVTKLRTGIAMEIPKGHVGLIQDRSGMGSKGFKVMGGVIDCGYLGDVSVCLYNSNTANSIATVSKTLALGLEGLSSGYDAINPEELEELKKMLEETEKDEYKVKAGDRIAQILILPYNNVRVVEVEELDNTERGEKGFGSSGK